MGLADKLLADGERPLVVLRPHVRGPGPAGPPPPRPAPARAAAGPAGPPPARPGAGGGVRGGVGAARAGARAGAVRRHRARGARRRPLGGLAFPALVEHAVRAHRRAVLRAWRAGRPLGARPAAA